MMGDAAQGEPIDADAGVPIDRTLAKLFAVSLVCGDAMRLVDLAQQARSAGIPERKIARAQTYAKDELVNGGEIDVE